MNLAAAVALILALAAPAAAVGHPNAIAPGYWETTNKVLSPVRSSKVERRCIRPEEVAKFMEGPSNHIYRCTYPTRVVSQGTIRLKGSCTTKKGPPVPVSGEGSFTRDTFHMEAQVAAQFGPMTVPIRATTDARRLGDDCPAAAEAKAE
ncbi:DUF3617 family protein [Phenylobacterium sp. LjRoot219]|uniref:DUF3617 domain-containing protein n=1 Tax=Phenylobacterium sp. LjRoot219 TaxID=3342283 RepID=UPI003ECE8705